MEFFNSIGQVIDFAIEREKEAMALYQDLAGKATSGQTRDIFLGFSAEEAGHKRKLEAAKLKADIREMKKKPPKLDHHECLTEIKPTPDMSLREALPFAIQCEKNAIRLYTDLAASLGGASFSGLFKILVKEEEKHQHRFEELLKAEAG
ncbi:MAG: ferritin family protein [Pontiellaceae bacterium]|jgi:rubrerythrin|nr:ferritin family protein [Pontiellaceae bacterium]